MTDQYGTLQPPPASLAEPHRPTRAELRRAAEAAAAGVAPPAAPVNSNVPTPTATEAASRVELRRLANERARAARSQNAIWKAWWFYPLVAALGLCVWFGVQSAANQPSVEPSVVTTITAQP
jgi:hypothetical protein